MPDRSAAAPPLTLLDLRAAGVPGDGTVPPSVLAAIASLPADGVLEVVTAREPSALARALREAGVFPEGGEQRGPFWLLRAGKQCPPPPEELTGLVPPEPMERILRAAAQLPPGGVYLAVLPHVPLPLFPHLTARGLAHAVVERPDGTALVWMRR